MNIYIRAPIKLKVISPILLFAEDTRFSSDESQYFPRLKESDFIIPLISPIIILTISGHTIIAAIEEPFFLRNEQIA